MGQYACLSSALMDRWLDVCPEWDRLLQLMATMENAFDRVADIIVIGTGAAGSVAAIEAFDRGNHVLMIEKAPVYGGTTRISAGGIWIPNSRFLQVQGVEDPKGDCLKFMARSSFPEKFDPAQPLYGLSQLDYALLVAFYDNGSKMIDAMIDRAGLSMAGGEVKTGRSNYYHYPEDKVPRGRGVKVVNPDGSIGRGDVLIGQLEGAVKRRGIPVLLNTRAQRIILNEAKEVLGIEAASTPSGEVLSFGARKGVVFATGGFAHNPDLRQKFLRQPIFGSCAAREIEGDFISMARGAGADMEGPSNGWWAEVVLEEVLAGPITGDVWVPPGDSMVVVNRYGMRVVSEKLPYHVRTPIHFHWDPVKGEYPNLLLFMVYDQRTAEKFNQSTTISYPMLSQETGYVMTGNTLDELAETLEKRLAEIARMDPAPTVQLAPDFRNNLRETIRKFNGYAQDGRDPDFHRGEIPVEKDIYLTQGGIDAGNDLSNVTLYPIADHGPYYAIILAAGLLDTHGGPRINARTQLLDSCGDPIPGLYGAGNCITGPAGKAYWGPGATIGLAMTFGYIAAVSAAAARRKETLAP